MNIVHLMRIVQLRIVLSWIAFRYLADLLQVELYVIPLLILTFAATIVMGMLLKEKKSDGIPLENSQFTPIDTHSPRLEDDVLINNHHLEIVISNEGVDMNQ